jgi:hypothetical protein
MNLILAGYETASKPSGLSAVCAGSAYPKQHIRITNVDTAGSRRVMLPFIADPMRY